MNYLLDTHTFIWFINGDSELPDRIKKRIEGNDLINFVSIASIWEIAIKINLGKLKLSAPFSEVPKQIEQNGFQILPITFEDTFTLSSLAMHHRDPFDRLIISQSISNDLTLLSKDPQFENYNIKVLW